MYHYLFSHFFVDGHLGCFHVLAFVTSAAMNHGIFVYFSILVSSVYKPQSGIAVSYGGFIPSFFKGSSYCLPWWLYQFTFPPTLQECSLFSTPFAAFIACRLFDDGHPDWCEVLSHCSFDLHLSMGFPGGSEVKVSACSAGDLGSISGWGKSPGEGNGNPLQ